MRWIAVALGLVGLVASVSASAADRSPWDTSPLVAEWKGGAVTVNEYVTWWGYGAGGDRKPLTTLDEKLNFLNTLVNANLMIEEAESIGITELPTVADWYKGRRVSTISDLLLTESTKGRVNVTERDVDEIYRKRLTEMELRQIVVAKRDQADVLFDSIKAGVPFEDLAMRYSTAPTGNQGGLIGKVKWGDFAERFSAQALRLEPGQVSEPFQVERGYCILKMDSKVLKEPADPGGEKKKIRGMLERDGVMRERTTYLDSLRAAYAFNIDIDAVVTLSAKYARAIEKRGERTAVVGDDIVPDLSDSDSQRPVATYTGGVFTTATLVQNIEKVPSEVRPRVDDPDEMVQYLTLRATDTLLVREGEKRGIAESPGVIREVERAKRRKTLLAFYDYITRDAAVPEEEARSFYDANKQAYALPEGWTISKIVVGTKEAADSILQRLDNGEPFAGIARVRSRDPFTAPQGGDVGFLPVGQDKEFDGFLATMTPGEHKEFRSLEGFVVLWLREKHTPRQATFAEARASVEQQLVAGHKEAIIQKWVDARRAERDVKVNTAVLEGIVVK